MGVLSLRAPNVYRHGTRAAVVALWALACVAGLMALGQYENTPGRSAEVTNQWPAGTEIVRNSAGPTLVMFAHPRCPCTRASIAELERVVAQSGGTIHPQVVFFTPSGMSQGWEQTDLWQSAAAIPGVEVSNDLDGSEAKRFHATTSGHTVLYDADGTLLFTGGITSARGHQGDNAGRSAVVSLLRSGTAECRDAPVYGCPIVTSLDPSVKSLCP
ncbi:MAG TPA: hypothetical protein VGG64_30345 [Pirellulales bacterium]|jgi:hypothetical protein